MTDVERHRSGRGDAGSSVLVTGGATRGRVPVPRPDCPRGLGLQTASGQRGRVRGLGIVRWIMKSGVPSPSPQVSQPRAEGRERREGGYLAQD